MKLKADPSMSYDQMLQTAEWYFTRKAIIDRDTCCTRCSSTKNLQVHHTFYYRMKTYPWLYPKSSLITLCDKCHAEIHATTEIEIRENVKPPFNDDLKQATIRGTKRKWKTKSSKKSKSKLYFERRFDYRGLTKNDISYLQRGLEYRPGGQQPGGIIPP